MESNTQPKGAPAGWVIRDRSDLEPGAIDIEGPGHPRMNLTTSHGNPAWRTLHALGKALLQAPAPAHAPDSTEGLRQLLAVANENDSARWEIAFRNIVAILYGPRHKFDIADVVERVRELSSPAPAEAGKPNGFNFDPLTGEVSLSYKEISAPAVADEDSRGMFVARLERMQEQGERWITIVAVLALLNDCDMLASRPPVQESQS